MICDSFFAVEQRKSREKGTGTELDEKLRLKSFADDAFSPPQSVRRNRRFVKMTFSVALTTCLVEQRRGGREKVIVCSRRILLLFLDDRLERRIDALAWRECQLTTAHVRSHLFSVSTNDLPNTIGQVITRREPVHVIWSHVRLRDN